jgi:hypothetical protein
VNPRDAGPSRLSPVGIACPILVPWDRIPLPRPCLFPECSPIETPIICLPLQSLPGIPCCLDFIVRLPEYLLWNFLEVDFSVGFFQIAQSVIFCGRLFLPRRFTGDHRTASLWDVLKVLSSVPCYCEVAANARRRGRSASFFGSSPSLIGGQNPIFKIQIC